MCLIALALNASSAFPFVLAANRDERHARPAAPATWWDEPAGVYGGRDLVAGGSWLLVDRHGRLAAVTNLPETGAPRAPRSRGELVTALASGARSLHATLADIGAAGDAYGAFNLLVVERGAAVCVSNRTPAIERLTRGIYSLGNAPLGTRWPKMAEAEAGLRDALRSGGDPTGALLDLLAERTTAATAEARYRESIFVAGDTYGTRCSTVVAIGVDGTLAFTERRYDARGEPTGESREHFTLKKTGSDSGI